MYFTDLEDLLARRQALRVSEHALLEAHKEGLRAKDVLYAVFNGEVIEHYPERERVLILGPMAKFNLPVHVVCDYADREEIVAVTVYIPSRTRWMPKPIRRRHGQVLPYENGPIP